MSDIDAIIRDKVSEFPVVWRCEVDTWLRDCKRSGKAEKTVISYAQNLRAAIQVVEIALDRQLAPRELPLLPSDILGKIQKELKSQGKSTSTVNSIRSVMRSFLRSTLQDNQGVGALFNTQSLPETRLPKSAPPALIKSLVPDIASLDDQLEFDFGAAPTLTRNMALLEVLCDTGATTAEISSLLRPSVEQADRRIIHLPGNVGQVMPRDIQISVSAQEALEAHYENWIDEIEIGSPIFCGTTGGALASGVIRKLLRETVDTFGLPYQIEPRMVRNGVARAWKEQGVQIPEIMRRLGVTSSSQLSNILEAGSENGLFTSPRSNGQTNIVNADSDDDYELARLPRLFLSDLAKNTAIRIATMTAYHKHADAFMSHLSERELDLIDADHICLKEYLSKSHSQTIRTRSLIETGILKFFRWATGEGYIEQNPFELAAKNYPIQKGAAVDIIEKSELARFFRCLDASEDSNLIKAGAVAALATTLTLQQRDLASLKREQVRIDPAGQHNTINLNGEIIRIPHDMAVRLSRWMNLNYQHSGKDSLFPSKRSSKISNAGKEQLGKLLRDASAQLGFENSITWRKVYSTTIVQELLSGTDYLELTNRCRFSSLSQLQAYILAANARTYTEASNDNINPESVSKTA